MFCSVPETINEIKNGNVIIVVDNDNRENVVDFICSAEYITPDIVIFYSNTRQRNAVLCFKW